MTTIVMVQTEDDVKIGTDSQISTHARGVNIPFSKVFVNNGIIIGGAGDCAGCDVLEFADLPAYDEETDARKWIVKTWAPAVRKKFKKAGYEPNDDGEYGVALLVVVDGQVFELEGDLSPLQAAHGQYAIGSGFKFSLGALHAGSTVMGALAAAKDNDLYTGGDLTVTLASTLLFENDVTTR